MNRETGKYKRMLIDGLFYLGGSVLYSLSVATFIAPNKISPGGVTGVATLINHISPFPVGTAILVINIPLLIGAWKRMGVDFTVRTSIVTVLVSVLIDVFSLFVPPFHGDIMLVAVFGGVFSGLGLGLIYMRGGTTGGSEIVALLVGIKTPHIPIGRLLLLVDAAVVAVTAAAFKNIESALYALILIYVSTALMDTLIYGRNKGKMLLIVTEHEDEVSKQVIQKIGRGVTKLNASGGYSGVDKQVLFCAVRPSEVYVLKMLVYDIDPHAFIVVVTTDEVLGEGFILFSSKR
ncbi:MAG: YitT family protein [Oscillospiraceae bacterium]|nr:YitT family protein [Oscillospiraceae bacterium]